MTSTSRGRPQASSRETLADAACELFLEQGYEATTVADITRRAGVSRSSFFNYFDGKTGALWYALDEHLDAVGSHAGTPAPLDALRERLASAPPHTLALAIVNADVMGVGDELVAGRALRQAALATRLARAHGTGRRDPLSAASVRDEIRAAADAAAVFGAIWRWAIRGAGSHSLSAEVDASLAELGQTPPAGAGRELRVTVIGTGAIGARVITELLSGAVPGAVLAGVVTRRAGAVREVFGDRAATITDFGTDLDRALRHSDLVVECAGIRAAELYGPRVIAAGTPLLLVSIGALATEATRSALEAGPGPLLLSTGAIGGLDLLTAAARPHGIPGGIDHARITSTKRATSLIQPWMTPDDAERVRMATEPLELFAGNVAAAVEQFPGSLNVACALAAATGLWDETRVRLVADPRAERTTHTIEASGAAGEYRFSVTNSVSVANPASSAVVAEAVLRGIAAVARPSGTFV